MADRYPRRIVAWLGVTIWSVAATACGLARGYWALLFARMGVGAGEAALTPVAHSAIADSFPRNRITFATSLYASSGTVGSSLALILGGILLALGSSLHGHAWPVLGELRNWQFAFIVAGAPGIFVALLAFTIAEPRRSGRPQSRGQGQWRPLLHFMRSHWQLYVCMLGGFGFAGILLHGLLTWTPTHLTRRFGLGPTEIGAYYGTISLICGLFSHAAKGIVVDWLFGRGLRDIHFRMYIWCAIVTGPIAAAAYLSHSLAFFLIGLAVTMFFLTPFLGYGAAAVQLVTPTELRGKMSGIFLLIISGIGFSVGPMLVALLTDKLFRDEAMLGQSIAVLIAVCVIPATVLLGIGCKYLRQALDEADGRR